MTNLNLKKLKRDKEKLEKLIGQSREQISQLNIQVLRLDGALGYVLDNIKEIEGVEDDR